MYCVVCSSKLKTQFYCNFILWRWIVTLVELSVASQLASHKWGGYTCYRLQLRKQLADVSTECSSCHQGEGEEAWKNIAIYSHALLIHIIQGQRSVRIAPPSLCLLITAVQEPGTSSPPSRLKHSSEGVIWMCRTSFTIGWWFFHACSATADFSTIPLSQASRCSFCLVSSLRLVSPM